MASIIRKSNGNCLVRVYCGEDAFGKKISKSAQFKPSKKGLSEARYNQELYQFVATFEEKIKEQ